MQNFFEAAIIDVGYCIPMALLGMFVSPAFGRISSTARLTPTQKDFGAVVGVARTKTLIAKNRRLVRRANKTRSPSGLSDQDQLIAAIVIAIATVGLYLKYQTSILWAVCGIAAGLFLASLLVIFFLSRRQVVARGGWSGYLLTGTLFVAVGLLDAVLLRAPWFGGPEFAKYVANFKTGGIFNSGDGFAMVFYQVVGVASFLIVAYIFIAFILGSITAVYVEMNSYGQWLYKGIFVRAEWAVSKGAISASIVLAIVSVALSSGLLYTAIRPIAGGDNDRQSPLAIISSIAPSTRTHTDPARSVQHAREVIPLTPTFIVASKAGPDSQDGAGEPVSFAAKNLMDGVNSTAWRVNGNGLGVTITLTFGHKVHVTSVGLIPGYDKIDPVTHENRFVQNRRVTSARWSTAQGSLANQTFIDKQTMQVMKFEANATTLRITITGSTASRGRDYTAISEVQVKGYMS